MYDIGKGSVRLIRRCKVRGIHTDTGNVSLARFYQDLSDQGYAGFKKCIISEVDISNQIISSKKHNEVQSLVDQFEAPTRLTIGYGSGVFEQKGYSKNNTSQIDLIHLVDDAEKFHEKNLYQYDSHYSGLKYFGRARTLVKVQNMAAGVYFNTFIRMVGLNGPAMVKYGIVSYEDCLKDVLEWKNFYMAGRLQKPVAFFGKDFNEIAIANQYNLKSAASVALLMMKRDEFNESDFYESIAKLSYLGDMRMLVGGENPNKVKNIVSKQFHNFRRLYAPFIQDFLDRDFLKIIEEKDNQTVFKMKLDSNGKAHLIDLLPLAFKARLYRLYESKLYTELNNDEKAKMVIKDSPTNHIKYGPFTASIAKDANLRKYLHNVVSSTVAFPAVLQTIKGIFTAGVVKAVKYAWAKNLKYRNS